jgi:hypothetical protein
LSSVVLWEELSSRCDPNMDKTLGSIATGGDSHSVLPYRIAFERQSGCFGTGRAVNGSIQDFVVGFVNNRVHAITKRVPRDTRGRAYGSIIPTIERTGDCDQTRSNAVPSTSG